MIWQIYIKNKEFKKSGKILFLLFKKLIKIQTHIRIVQERF